MLATVWRTKATRKNEATALFIATAEHGNLPRVGFSNPTFIPPHHDGPPRCRPSGRHPLLRHLGPWVRLRRRARHRDPDDRARASVSRGVHHGVSQREPFGRNGALPSLADPLLRRAA